jgi:hypothetical protein
MPEHLSERDKLGIHVELLCGDAAIRFSAAMKAHHDDLQERTCQWYACCHAFRADSGRVFKSPREFYLFLQEHEAWKQGPLKDSNERLEKAAPEQLIPQRMVYEPVYTLAELVLSSGWIDFEADGRSLVRSLELVEGRGRQESDLEGRRGVREEIGQLPLDEATLVDTVCMIFRESQGARPFYVTKDGQIRLGERRVRDALDTQLGAVASVREKRYDEGEIEDAHEKTATGRGPQESESERKESFEIFLAWRRQRQSKAPRKSVEALVLERFPELARKDLSIRALAEESGRDRKSLAAVFDSLKDELRRKLEQ